MRAIAVLGEVVLIKVHPPCYLEYRYCQLDLVFMRLAPNCGFENRQRTAWLVGCLSLRELERCGDAGVRMGSKVAIFAKEGNVVVKRKRERIEAILHYDIFEKRARVNYL